MSFIFVQNSVRTVCNEGVLIWIAAKMLVKSGRPRQQANVYAQLNAAAHSEGITIKLVNSRQNYKNFWL
jgi:hypothetical protein